MIKILHRYIVKEFVSSFIFGLTVFSAILLLDQIFQLIDLFLSKGVGFFLIFQLFILIIPNILSLTIPMAILFGVLLSYGRLSEDNEITVMKATGINYKTLSMPIIVFVMFISIGLIYFNHSLSPSTHMYFRTLYKQILTKTPLAKFDEKTITDIGGYRIYAHKVNSKNNTLAGVNIYKFVNDKKNDNKKDIKSDKKNEESVPWRIASSSATVSVEKNVVILKLYDGYWQRSDPNKLGSMIHMNFSTYKFAIPFGDTVDFDDVSLREMTSKKLRAKIKTFQDNDTQIYTYNNEYWFRWVLAVAPIIFAIIAIPIGIMAGKGGKAIGFGMSLGVIFVYYMLLVVALNIGEKGYIPSCYIMWLPNFVIASIGLILFKKMGKK
ncbi:MAG: LptF/LptG family permease [Endomicrobiaceae bacterium]|jgi:lipopolysaccharide export system permease protein|nr:LptF/LptG family permease [Endomicrobiaceae bacterium]